MRHCLGKCVSQRSQPHKRKDFFILLQKIQNDLYLSKVNTIYGEGHVNIYLFLGKDGVDTIDIGPYSDNTLDSLTDCFDELKIKFSDLKNIYLTHGHEDHAGLGEYFSSNFSTNIYIHSRDVVFYKNYRGSKFVSKEKINGNFLKLGVPKDLLEEIYFYVSKKWPVYNCKFNNFKYLDGISTIRAGNQELNVLYTPGHSPGSVCYYYDKERNFFTGDTVLPNITANPGSILFIEMMLNGDNFNNPLGQLIDSLKRIRKNHVKHIFPSHGKTTISGDIIIERYLMHHKKRLNEIFNMLKENGASTCFQICRKIYRFLGNRDLMLQLLEIEAHLRLLEYEKKILKVTLPGLPLTYGWEIIRKNSKGGKCL